MLSCDDAGQQYVGRAISKEFVDEAAGHLRPFSGSVASYDPVHALYVLTSDPIPMLQS